MSSGSVRFAGWAVAVSSIVAGVALPVVRPYGAEVLRWALAGWAVTTAIGVAGGSWALAWHGRTGAGFLVAFGVCMLARVLALGFGALAASQRGGEAVAAYLGGLLLGYLPPQAAEVLWLMRAARRS